MVLLCPKGLRGKKAPSVLFGSTVLAGAGYGFLLRIDSSVVEDIMRRSVVEDIGSSLDASLAS